MTSEQPAVAGPATVRPARPGDAGHVLAGVESLVRELSGDPSRVITGMSGVFDRLCAPDSTEGGILVAEVPGSPPSLAGLLAFTVQPALRIGADYCLIQELWVAAGGRSHGVGAALLEALRSRCAARGIGRVEVCLPHPRFAEFERTLAFYLANGFEALGPRLIASLP